MDQLFRWQADVDSAAAGQEMSSASKSCLYIRLRLVTWFGSNINCLSDPWCGNIDYIVQISTWEWLISTGECLISTRQSIISTTSSAVSTMDPSLVDIYQVHSGNINYWVQYINFIMQIINCFRCCRIKILTIPPDRLIYGKNTVEISTTWCQISTFWDQYINYPSGQVDINDTSIG